MRPILVRIVLVLAMVLMWRVAHASSLPEIGDREVVLQTIAMESASEPEGMPYVALTLINRARIRGTTLSHEAKRPKQYSAWNDPKWAMAWLGGHYGQKTRLEASNALEMAFKMAHAGQYPTMRHYHTEDTRPYWAKGKRASVVLGGHKFYEGIK